jgi:ABC-type ATPase involved in cell division
MVFLTGRSGAGKSTILKLISLLERPTRGLVMVNGHNTAALSSRKIPAFRRELGVACCLNTASSTMSRCRCMRRRRVSR